jgi:uncharacterized phage protein gp47/JayE
MIFKRLWQKRNARHLRQRVESCVTTILALDTRLGEGTIEPEVIQQFERLRESLLYVTDESVNEEDIGQIEEATNQLLDEIRNAYGMERPVSINGACSVH